MGNQTSVRHYIRHSRFLKLSTIPYRGCQRSARIQLRTALLCMFQQKTSLVLEDTEEMLTGVIHVLLVTITMDYKLTACRVYLVLEMKLLMKKELILKIFVERETPASKQGKAVEEYIQRPLSDRHVNNYGELLSLNQTVNKGISRETLLFLLKILTAKTRLSLEKLGNQPDFSSKLRNRINKRIYKTANVNMFSLELREIKMAFSSTLYSYTNGIHSHKIFKFTIIDIIGLTETYIVI
ncbi:uncharacterized protein LOC143228474 [Tachypleus tridentatus]|uniref:uncharacterized protein LOC143228474 n=1 Tax=Tachypleus tridentatus TaxID=6853 RepID=UPI003FCF8B8B